MLPVRLEIKNFLPYRSPAPLHFDGVHLACLTGSNGAGKTSLLDAITYALWGKARAGRIDDLVHLGQTEMRVQLDFEQEGQLYRVVRSRNVGKRGVGALDLFVQNAADTTWTLINEGSVRETQYKINALLRLEYETFVHSAFLQQGKADAFTTRTPAERKRLLSDILGLKRWERYEEATKEKLSEINAALNYLDQRIDEIDGELAARPGLEAELADAIARYEAASAAREAAQAQLDLVKSAPDDLRRAQEDIRERQDRLQGLGRDGDECDDNIANYRQQMADYQQTIAQREAIEAGYAALNAAREADADLRDKLRQFQVAKDERAGYVQVIAAARARLEADLMAAAGRITTLEAQTAEDVAAEIEALQAEVAALDAAQAQRDRLDGEVNTAKNAQAGRKTRLEGIEEQGKALRERLDALEKADPAAAVCPVCGQPLDADGLAKLIAEVGAEVEARRADYKAVKHEMDAEAGRIRQASAEVRKLDATLKGRAALDQQVGTLRQKAQARETALGDLAAAREQHAALAAQLSAEDYAREAREALAALDERLAALDYDDERHRETQNTLDSHAEFERRYTLLGIALESLPGVEDRLRREEDRRARLVKAVADLQAEIAEREAGLEALRARVAAFQEREDELRRQQTMETEAQNHKIACEQQLRALDAQAEKREQLLAARDTRNQQRALYGELRQAFGKNGVPAMMIETAIPELERDANALLARMTSGRMHVRFNMQKEKVTGGAMETLELAIADELGDRPYEMYSGGEAFRINFAVRVALSKMLARRAGAQLRTLFIDEGFGTQDEDGRAKLVEAISVIQHAFDLVLVITHIDELRDSFPVQITVQKSAEGSQILLM